MIRVRSPALEDDVSLLRTQRSELKQSGAVRRWSTRHAQLRQAAVSHSRRCASRASAHATRAGPRATCVAVDRCGTSRSQRSATCASQAHSGFGDSVPASVPKLRPRCINRQPTPTKEPTKNGPEIVRFQARSVTRCQTAAFSLSATSPCLQVYGKSAFARETFPYGDGTSNRHADAKTAQNGAESGRIETDCAVRCAVVQLSFSGGPDMASRSG
jgi:hypothetical protein